MVTDELLHLGAVVKLQECSDTPHQREDVQPLVMVSGNVRGILLVFGDEAGEYLGRLWMETLA